LSDTWWIVSKALLDARGNEDAMNALRDECEGHLERNIGVGFKVASKKFHDILYDEDDGVSTLKMEVELERREFKYHWDSDDVVTKTDIYCPSCGTQTVVRIRNENKNGSNPLVCHKCTECKCVFGHSYA
jgi:hypothetical protein